MSNTVKHECPKCSGKGHIEGFGHRDNGRCYLCAGVGTVDSIPADMQGAMYMTAGMAVDALGEHEAQVGLACNPDWVAHMVTRAAKALLAVNDTRLARALLNEATPAVRKLIVDKGWELKGR